MIIDNMEMLPTAMSCHKRLEFENKITGSQLEKELDNFLLFLIRDLKLNGCKLIGHVKGLASAHNNGHLMFSITDFNEKTRFKGEISQKIASVEFTINIIIYGIELMVVNKVFEKAYDKFFN